MDKLMFTPLSNAQIKAAIDSEQLFAALQDAAMQSQAYQGGMHWKTIANREYLYRTRDRLGNAKSLGVKSEETLDIFNSFIGRKGVLKSRVDDLKNRLHTQAKINAAYRVGHVDNHVADICEQLAKAGLLDTNMLIIGTNALHAYEAMAGIRFEADIMATTDIDLLWNHTSKLSLLSSKQLHAEGLIGLLRRADKSYEIIKNQPFRAVANSGYMVDLIRQMPHPPWADEPDRFFKSDMIATDIWNMKWLISAPKISQTVIALNGRIFTMSVPDPRAFAMFKWWLSTSDERMPAKKQRDATQAMAVIKMIAEYLPHLNQDWMAIQSFPKNIIENTLKITRT
jgi:hypothetical protein